LKKVIIILVVLVLIVGVTALLNRQGIEEKAASQRDAILFIVSDNFEAQVDFDTILELKEVEFQAVLRSSGKPAVDTTFTGVQLKDILEKVGAKTDGKTQVITKAVDGYVVALSMDEVLEDDNVYIVYKRDGKDLGRKEEGGSGPYQVVIRKDQFGQRWNKFLMEIELK
jgi:DMSO/TMAO reductase YedYZ molybdopterin-dependent catalytic subunit